MPELPEVECLTQAIRPILEGAVVAKATFLRPDLRGPIPIEEFQSELWAARSNPSPADPSICFGKPNTVMELFTSG